MSRAAALVHRQERALSESKGAKFIVRSTKGTLSDNEFRRYLVIEEAFVLTAVRILGLVVAESESIDDAHDHVVSLSNLVGEQRAFFADLRDEFPYTGDASALVEQSSVLSTYSLSLARTNGRAAALTAMFAAETLYLSWCREAVAVTTERAPALQNWIEMHTEPAFVQQVQALAREVDGLPPSVTDDHLDRWFSGTLVAEIEFHNVASP